MADLESLIERLRALDTCTVSDALDALGLPGAVNGIVPTWPCGRLAGRVLTVQLRKRDEVPGTPPRRHGVGAIAAASPGDVIVVDNAAGEGISAGWGGLLARGALSRAVGGIIVNGAARDIDELEEIGLPLFARSATPRSSRARTAEASTGTPLQIEDVTVEAGDLVLADRSGVVFVSAALADAVLERAEEIFAMEQQIAARLDDGTSVTDALL